MTFYIELAIQYLKAKRPDCKIMVHSGDESMHEWAEENGFPSVLKPARLSDIQEAVRQAVGEQIE